MASTAPLPTGQTVGGRFRIQSVEHRSGMSTVYRASDERAGGIPVALKEFSAAALPADERGEALIWLTREASLLSTLNHPRLPKLVAAFSEGDRHYLAMPFLQGSTLEELVSRDGPQEEARVLHWAHDLTRLLSYLHRQDTPVIHRDLKPANVLLQGDGTLMLLDLGVARPLDRRRIGTAIGTPGYAPPEQYQGLADERSDLYALGATMHRLLTGYDPEHVEPFRHPPVRELNPVVTETTARLVADLLQVAPEARPPSAGAVMHALDLAERAAEARIVLPIRAMYRQMLWLLAAAVGIGAILYAVLYDAAAASGLPLLLMPGLLLFAPLASPRLRAAIAQRPDLGQHPRRAVQVFLRAYVFIFLVHLSFAPWLTPLLAAGAVGRWLFDGYNRTDPGHGSTLPRQIAP